MVVTKPATDTRTAILSAAVSLFSQRCYEAVSMKDISEAVHISAPALYNHFGDKRSLYIAAIAASFANKSDKLLQALSGQDKPIVRLEHFVARLSEMFYDDPDFRLLMQRELLEKDEERLRYLAQEIFGIAFIKFMDLLKEIKPDCDAHMLAVMIVGMIQKPFELNPLARFFPDSQSQHTDPNFITHQVMDLLTKKIA